MDKIWELLERNVLVSSFIAAAFVATACVMWGLGREIPDPLEAGLMLVLGYFLGAKAQGAIRSSRSRE